MQRFSVSVDDELAAWIESQADERGVSKAKVIRDAVATAQFTGLVHTDEDDIPAGEQLLDRIATLEERVTALESETGETTADTDDTGGDPVDAFAAQLEGQPPTTEHGETAVIRVFSLLVEDGPLQTSDLRDQLYPDFETEFASPKSMWQSINRYFDALDGIEKVGHGKWDADPDSVGSSKQ